MTQPSKPASLWLLIERIGSAPWRGDPGRDLQLAGGEETDDQGGLCDGVGPTTSTPGARSSTVTVPALAPHHRDDEQWIREGKNALRWTRLSCHAFRHNAVRLQLH